MTPEQCRTQAEEMRKKAARAIDPDVRESFLTMAADWDKLAEDAAELLKRQGRAPPTR